MRLIRIGTCKCSFEIIAIILVLIVTLVSIVAANQSLNREIQTFLFTTSIFIGESFLWNYSEFKIVWEVKLRRFRFHWISSYKEEIQQGQKERRH